MKTTIALPDHLLAAVQVLADREQRTLDELVTDLVRAGIESRSESVSSTAASLTAEQWLDEWLRLGEESLRVAPDGPTATEILDEDRDRLERPPGC